MQWKMNTNFLYCFFLSKNVNRLHYAQFYEVEFIYLIGFILSLHFLQMFPCFFITTLTGITYKQGIFFISKWSSVYLKHLNH